MKIYKALTIAGSDYDAGAGIQTFAALGVYGTSVIAAITAQNTKGVTQIFELSPELIAAQIDAVISDIGAQARCTSPASMAEPAGAHAARVRTTAATARTRISSLGRALRSTRPYFSTMSPLRLEASARNSFFSFSGTLNLSRMAVR